MSDQKNSKSSSELRRQHNLDLVRRMRGGESLNAYDSKASWFPPRPMIKKDEKEISRVYKAEAPHLTAKETKAPAAQPKESANIVQFVPQAPLSKRGRHFDEAG
jgi:hypothetical protein